jgi:hypothetical protein
MVLLLISLKFPAKLVILFQKTEKKRLQGTTRRGTAQCRDFLTLAAEELLFTGFLFF